MVLTSQHSQPFLHHGQPRNGANEIGGAAQIHKGATDAESEVEAGFSGSCRFIRIQHNDLERSSKGMAACRFQAVIQLAQKTMAAAHLLRQTAYPLTAAIGLPQFHMGTAVTAGHLKPLFVAAADGAVNIALARTKDNINLAGDALK